MIIKKFVDGDVMSNRENMVLIIDNDSCVGRGIVEIHHQILKTLMNKYVDNIVIASLNKNSLRHKFD